MEQFGHFWSFKIGKYKGTNSNHILELAQVWDIGISKPILIGIWNWLYKLQLWFLKVWEYFQHDQWIQKYRSERWPDETNEDKRFKEVMARICNNNPLQTYVCVFDMVTVLKKYMGHKSYEETEDLLKCHHCTEQ